MILWLLSYIFVSIIMSHLDFLYPKLYPSIALCYNLLAPSSLQFLLLIPCHYHFILSVVFLVFSPLSYVSLYFSTYFYLPAIHGLLILYLSSDKSDHFFSLVQLVQLDVSSSFPFLFRIFECWFVNFSLKQQFFIIISRFSPCGTYIYQYRLVITYILQMFFCFYW